MEEVQEDLDTLFVEELPHYLRCSICLCCLNNPYQTPCGHRFCKECIIPVMRPPNNLCPQDRTVISLDNTFPDNAVRLQINNLKIKCPKEECEWTGSLSDKDSHLKKCKYVAVPCQLCGKAILKAVLATHMTVCPKRKVACEYCEREVSHAEIKSHYQDCPNYPVPCQYKCRDETFLRKEINNHITNECPCIPVMCSMAPFGCTERVERGHLANHEVACAKQRCVQMASTILNLMKTVEELKVTISQQTEVIKGVEDSLYPCLGQFTWRIDDIRLKIKQAQAGDPATSVLYSPPFFSSEAGYKLCLCIYPAGDNNQGYLSLYFVVMKGQFDEVVPWPFQKRVVLTLLNCKGGQHVTKDIQPDPRLHYFHRPENPRNVGYGYPKFIILNKLLHEDSDFVENGAIFLRSKVYD